MIELKRVFTGELINNKSLRSQLGETTADCRLILRN